MRATADLRYGPRTQIPKPPGVFRGVNFMTPEIIGYYKLRKGLGYAELSQGEGFAHEPIFGVTVEPTKDLSKLFHSRTQAMAYIYGLSK